ncbi:MAG TPA: Uma2 family endonuclease [Thermoanaerobaculia bacterium]|nr:Uma2 family endonuclease [Thermoanaerobaculia bacterium]
MSVATPAAPSAIRDHDHIVVLTGATWADFQRLLEIRGERSSPRLAYLEGRLEMMTPSRSHEGVKSMIGCLLEAWCLERGIDITPYGSWLLEDKAAEGGVEPDECYVVGGDEEPARPDLAIEVVWTHGRIDKLDLYRRLGVCEVWYWRDGRLELYALRGQSYEPIQESGVLPGIDVAQLLRFLAVKPMTRAVREYRQALRDTSGG